MLLICRHPDLMMSFSHQAAALVLKRSICKQNFIFTSKMPSFSVFPDTWPLRHNAVDFNMKTWPRHAAIDIRVNMCLKCLPFAWNTYKTLQGKTCTRCGEKRLLLADWRQRKLQNALFIHLFSFFKRYYWETKQRPAKWNTGQCLGHGNKPACRIWSCFDNVQFRQNLQVSFLPSALQFVCFYPMQHFLTYWYFLSQSVIGAQF